MSEIPAEIVATVRRIDVEGECVMVVFHDDPETGYGYGRAKRFAAALAESIGAHEVWADRQWKRDP